MQYYSPLQLKLLICLPSVLGLFRIYKILQLSNLSFPKSRGKKPTNPHNQRTLLFSGHTCFECLLTVEVIQEMKIALQKSLFLATSHVPDTLLCLQQSEVSHLQPDTNFYPCVSQKLHCGTAMGTTLKEMMRH